MESGREVAGTNSSDAVGYRPPMSAARLAAPFLEFLPLTGVSIAVFTRTDQPSTIFASDPLVALLEQSQLDLGEGPLFDVAHTREACLVPHLPAGTDDWPIFGSVIFDTDAKALFVFPLLIGAACVGVVTSYRLTSGELKPDAVSLAVALTRSIAVPALRHAIHFASEDSPAGPESPIELRREVHQAVGMILGQLGTTATTAFVRLRAHAFATGRTVSDVSGDVIRRELDFSLLPE